jgi:hypothetical protein
VRGFVRGCASSPASAVTKIASAGIASAGIASAGIAEDVLDDAHRTVRRP